MASDDLRTRIAAAALLVNRCWNCGIDDEACKRCQSTALQTADAVIRELEQQWRADYGYDGYQSCDTREEAAELVTNFNAALGDDWRDGEQAMVLHRYVTEWTADE